MNIVVAIIEIDVTFVSLPWYVFHFCFGTFELDHGGSMRTVKVRWVTPDHMLIFFNLNQMLKKTTLFSPGDGAKTKLTSAVNSCFYWLIEITHDYWNETQPGNKTPKLSYWPHVAPPSGQSSHVQPHSWEQVNHPEVDFLFYTLNSFCVIFLMIYIFSLIKSPNLFWGLFVRLIVGSVEADSWAKKNPFPLKHTAIKCRNRFKRELYYLYKQMRPPQCFLGKLYSSNWCCCSSRPPGGAHAVSDSLFQEPLKNTQ